MNNEYINMHTELIPDNCENWREVEVTDECKTSLRDINGIWMYVIEDRNGNIVNNFESRYVTSSDSSFDYDNRRKYND